MSFRFPMKSPPSGILHHPNNHNNNKFLTKLPLLPPIPSTPAKIWIMPQYHIPCCLIPTTNINVGLLKFGIQLPILQVANVHWPGDDCLLVKCQFHNIFGWNMLIVLTNDSPRITMCSFLNTYGSPTSLKTRVSLGVQITTQLSLTCPLKKCHLLCVHLKTTPPPMNGENRLLSYW